jgi:hypothetical protein
MAMICRSPGFASLHLLSVSVSHTLSHHGALSIVHLAAWLRTTKKEHLTSNHLSSLPCPLFHHQLQFVRASQTVRMPWSKRCTYSVQNSSAVFLWSSSEINPPKHPRRRSLLSDLRCESRQGCIKTLAVAFGTRHMKGPRFLYASPISVRSFYFFGSYVLRGRRRHHIGKTYQSLTSLLAKTHV